MLPTILPRREHAVLLFGASIFILGLTWVPHALAACWTDRSDRLCSVVNLQCLCGNYTNQADCESSFSATCFNCSNSDAYSSRVTGTIGTLWQAGALIGDGCGVARYAYNDAGGVHCTWTGTACQCPLSIVGIVWVDSEFPCAQETVIP